MISAPMASAMRGSTPRITSRALLKAVEAVAFGVAFGVASVAMGPLLDVLDDGVAAQARGSSSHVVSHVARAAPRWSIPSLRASHGPVGA